MFTSTSRYAPDSFKENMLAAIRAARPAVKLGDGEQEGRRFDDDEDCFQAACMIVSRGIDVFNEAVAMEHACAAVTDFEALAFKALKSAAGSDFHYAHEKDWGSAEDAREDERQAGRDFEDV